MIDRLSGIGSAIDHDAISRVELQLFGQAANDHEQVPQQRSVGVGYVLERGDLLFGDHDDMRGVCGAMS